MGPDVQRWNLTFWMEPAEKGNVVLKHAAMKEDHLEVLTGKQRPN